MSIIGKRIIVTNADYEDIAINRTTTRNITVNVTNGTYQGAETIEEGTSENVTIAPNTGYYLPTTITVTGANYTYNSTTGVIVLSNPTDNVVITVVCVVPTVYTITTNVTNGTYQGAGTITEGTTENITITPNTGYYLPNSVTVTGTSYVYDEETGVITLSNPTDDVAITVVCTDTKPEPLPTLVQGYWSSSGDILPNRVCNETLIKGIQTITTKPGYVIRAVYAYKQEFTHPQNSSQLVLKPYYAVPNGMEATTSTDRTTYTTLNANYYYGVTFAKTDASANILPTEDIVDSWELSE